MLFDGEKFRCELEFFYLDAKKLFEWTLHSGSQFPWEIVYSFAARYPQDICRDYNLGDFIEYLLEKVCDKPDAHLIATVINLNAINIKINVRDRSTSAKEILRHLQSQRDSHNVCDGVVYNILDIWDVIGNGDMCFMKLLARYGVIRPEICVTHQEQLDASSMLRTCLWRVATTDLWDTRNPLWKPTEEHIQTASDRLDITGNGILGMKERDEFVRRCTILKVLQVIFTPFQCSEKQKRMFECLRLYFDAVTEPVVSVKELEDLTGIRQHSPPLFGDHYVKTAMDMYRTEFPESAILEPRSLQQLSICAARTNFIKNGTLPGVMSELRLPKRIKSFILLTQLE